MNITEINKLVLQSITKHIELNASNFDCLHDLEEVILTTLSELVSKSESARLMGVNVRTIRSKYKQYDIEDTLVNSLRERCSETGRFIH
jgi:DNA-binding protein Fis